MADLMVLTLRNSCTHGRIVLGGLSFPCALGRSGLGHFKHEGDGRTPNGCWRIERIFWRPDRRYRPGRLLRFLPGRQLKEDDGWCDTPSDRNYNRHVRLPYDARAERLWRSDHLYDFIVVLSHNRRPRIKGGGSAIFLHVAATGPDERRLMRTEGCVALRRRDLAIVLSYLRPGSRIRIGC